jgi:hypothetical protein
VRLWAPDLTEAFLSFPALEEGLAARQVLRLPLGPGVTVADAQVVVPE